MEAERERRHKVGEAAVLRERAAASEEVCHYLVHLKGATPGKRTEKPYQQQRCKGETCNALIRTFCSCDRTLFFCLKCHAMHMAERR